MDSMTTPPIIEGYEIIGKIADGGMSTVWKAKQLSLDRLVALKVLHEDLVKADRDVERFKTEAKSAATLRHSGLCEIYDAGETPDGAVYYAMEYVAGFSIHQLLSRKGDLPEKQALLVGQGVAQVLMSIWEKNHVVHCDIKPDNILIDQDGTIRVTDLGLSRVISRIAAHSDEGYIVGTPNYMSPEQAQGSDDLDFRTDVYGLGATLYQMITGIMPFANVSDSEAADRHINDYIADPQALNLDVSHATAALIEKMMIKDRAARYHTWQEVIQDIEEVRAGRLPRGGLVPAGQSTVSRSAEREAATQKLIDEMRPRRADSATTSSSLKDSAPPDSQAPTRSSQMAKGKRTGAAGPRQRGPRNRRPVAPRSPADGLKLKSRPSSPSTSGSSKSRLVQTDETWGAVAQKTFLLLILVGATYAGSFYMLGRRLQPETVRTAVAPAVAEEPTTPVRHPDLVPEPRIQPAPAPDPLPPARPRPAPQPAPEPEPEALTWDHPEYVEALNLIAQGRERLQQFEQQQDASLLDSIEPDSRRAIGTLNRLRPEAPADAEIQHHVQRAFQLINNTREARLLSQ